MPNDTSERLRRNIPHILTRWEEEAVKIVHSAYGLTSLVLKNAIHSFLENIADALSTTIDRTHLQAAQDNSNILNFAKIHGGGRATEPLHYTLAEVILEFQILHRVVLEVLEDHGPLPRDDRRIITLTIDKALSAAATQFAMVHQQVQEQFALNLVHDLRAPANVAKMSAFLIKSEATASKDSHYLAEKIDENMDRLESMLKQLLDASRVRPGLGISFEFKEFCLDELAKQVVQDMDAAYGGKIIIHAPEPVTGTWNPAGLRRVFENLIINALKYGTPNSPVRIVVTQNAEYAIFCVHNEGNPISEEDRPKLFQKFKRGATATTQTGWGLGLALVSGMVAAHHGTVKIESSLANGTDFLVELPKKPRSYETSDSGAQKA